MESEIVKKKGKRYSIILAIFIVIFNVVILSGTAYADEFPTDNVIVDVEVTGDNNGQVKAGSEIDIVYKLSNLNGLYAASIDLTYDNSLIKVNSIEAGEKISGNVYEAYKDLAKNGNRARYAFTFLGNEEKGLSGKADFVKIKATVLKDGELDVKKSTTNYEFVQKTGNEMKKVKESYINSQGETAKVEVVEEEVNTSGNKTNEESGTSPNSKVNEEEKVTILGTNNSTKAVSNEEAKNESTEQNSSDEVSKGSSNDSSEEKGEDNSPNNEEHSQESLKSDNEKSEVNKSDNKNIGIVIAISVVVLVIASGIYIKKKKIRK